MFIDQDTQFGYKYNLLTLVLLCVLTMSRLNVHLSFQMLIESFAGEMCNTAQDHFFFLQKTWFGQDSLVEMFWSHNITVSYKSINRLICKFVFCLSIPPVQISSHVMGLLIRYMCSTLVLQYLPFPNHPVSCKDIWNENLLLFLCLRLLT